MQQQQLLEFRKNYDAAAIEVGLDEGNISRIEELAKALMTERKKRNVSQYMSVDKIAMFRQTGDYRTHSSTTPGILSVALDFYSAQAGRRACFTGGADGSIIYFDLDSGKTLTRLTNHMKAVNSVVAHPLSHILISGSDDKTMRVWHASDMSDNDQDFRCSHVVRSSKAAVSSVSLHASGEYFMGCSSDGLWHLIELESGRVVKVCRDIPSPCHNVQFHPDGLLASGSGSDGNVHIWDLRTQALTSSLSHQSGGSLSYIDFSENGYHMASVTQKGQIHLWDLRKSKVFASAECNVSPSVIDQV